MKSLITKIYAFAAIVACSFTYATEAEADANVTHLINKAYDLSWDNDNGKIHIADSCFNNLAVNSVIVFTYTLTNSWGQIQINDGKWNVLKLIEDQNNDGKTHSCVFTLTNSVLTQIRNNAQYGNSLHIQGTQVHLTDMYITVPASLGITNVKTENLSFNLTSNGEKINITSTVTNNLPQGDILLEVDYTGNGTGSIKANCTNCSEKQSTTENGSAKTAFFAFPYSDFSNIKGNAIVLTGENVTVNQVRVKVERIHGVTYSDDLPLGVHWNRYAIPVTSSNAASFVEGGKIVVTCTEESNPALYLATNLKAWNWADENNAKGTFTKVAEGKYSYTIDSELADNVTNRAGENRSIILYGQNITISTVEVVEPVVVNSYTWEGTQALTNNGEIIHVAKSFLASIPTGEVSVDVKYNNNNQAGALSLKCNHCDESNYAINKELSANSNDQTVRFSFSADQIAHFKSNAIEITGTNVTVKSIVFNVVRRYSESGKQEDFPLLGMRRIYTIASSAFTNLQPGATMSIDCTYNNEDGKNTAGEFGIVCNLEEWHNFDEQLGSISKLSSGQHTYEFTLNEAFLNHVKGNADKGARNVKVLGSNIIINSVRINSGNSVSWEEQSDRWKWASAGDEVKNAGNFKEDSWYILGYKNGDTTYYLYDNNGTLGISTERPQDNWVAYTWKNYLFRFDLKDVINNEYSYYSYCPSTNELNTDNNLQLGNTYNVHPIKVVGNAPNFAIKDLWNNKYYYINNNASVDNSTTIQSNWFAFEVTLSDVEIPSQDIFGEEKTLNEQTPIEIAASFFNGVAANSTLSIVYTSSNNGTMALKYNNGSDVIGSQSVYANTSGSMDITLAKDVLNRISTENLPIKLYGSGCIVASIYITPAGGVEVNPETGTAVGDDATVLAPTPYIYYDYVEGGTRVTIYSKGCPIKYTLDGTFPRTSKTAITAEGNVSFLVTRETTVRAISLPDGSAEYNTASRESKCGIPVLANGWMVHNITSNGSPVDTYPGLVSHQIPDQELFDKSHGFFTCMGKQMGSFSGKISYYYEMDSLARPQTFVPDHISFRVNNLETTTGFVNYKVYVGNEDTYKTGDQRQEVVFDEKGWTEITVNIQPWYSTTGAKLSDAIHVQLWTDGNKGEKYLGLTDIQIVGKYVDSRDDNSLSDIENMVLNQSATATRTVSSSASSDGEIKVSSSNNEVATAVYNNGTITVTGNGRGTAIITVAQNGNETYKPAFKSFTVTVNSAVVTNAVTWAFTTGNYAGIQYEKDTTVNPIYWRNAVGYDAIERQIYDKQTYSSESEENIDIRIQGLALTDNSAVDFYLPSNNNGGILSVTFGPLDVNQTATVAINGNQIDSVIVETPKEFCSQKNFLIAAGCTHLIVTKVGGSSDGIISTISWSPASTTNKLPSENNDFSLSVEEGTLSEKNWQSYESSNGLYSRRVYNTNKTIQLNNGEKEIESIIVYATKDNSNSNVNVNLEISNCDSEDNYTLSYSSATPIHFKPKSQDAQFNISFTKDQSVDFYVEVLPKYDYVRVLNGIKIGAICLPYDVKEGDYKGGIFCKIESRRVDSDNVPTHLILREVKSLEAGCPYIFIADNNSTCIKLKYSGSAALEPKNNESHNGLYGTYDKFSFGEHDFATGKYYVINTRSAFQMAGRKATVGANKAYIIMDEVRLEGSAPSSAPGRRFVVGYEEFEYEEGEYSEDETCIEFNKQDASEDCYYDLEGRKQFGTSNGLIIANGKVILKK